tara:strand:+ start:17657 stop:19708 length:2052 start_codon:yes stop_codon:yes gene_type:complete
MSESTPKKENLMNKSEKKEQEELKKKLEEKAKYDGQVQAEKELAMRDLKIKRQKEKRQRELEKNTKRRTDVCKANETDFYVKIKYKCPKICGKKSFIFNSNKDKYQFIDKGDIVLYDNPHHSNHNREATVISYRMEGTGAKDFDKNKKRPYFVIQFTDDIDKLPFYKLNINGVEVTTNKKIVIMKGVSYDNLKLLFSSKNKDFICIEKLKGKKEGNLKENFKTKLKEQYSKNNNNTVFDFNELVIVNEKKITEIIKKMDKNGSITKMNKKRLQKKGKGYKIKNLKNKTLSLLKFVQNIHLVESADKKKELNKILSYLTAVFGHSFDIGDINKEYVDNKLFIYHVLYFELFKKSKKKLKYIKDYKEKNFDSENLENVQQKILFIKRKFEVLEKSLINRYSEKFPGSDWSNANKLFQKKKNDLEDRIADKKLANKKLTDEKLTNKKLTDEKLTDEKPMERAKQEDIAKIQKELKSLGDGPIIASMYNRPFLDKKRGITLQQYTYKNYIIDELKKIVRKHFIKGKEFKPIKVFLKYANPELVKLDIIEKQSEEKRQDKKIISYTDMNKLVTPTDDKIFILSSITPFFDKNYNKLLYDADDFFNDNIKIDLETKIIEVTIDIGLTVMDKKSKETIFKDDINDKNFIHSVKEFVTNFGDNLNCQISKENIKKDIIDIKKKLGMGVPDN